MQRVLLYQLIDRHQMKTEKLASFLNYLEKEVLPATEDLAKLADANRKHIQKLIYTNLVDRFDAMVDGLLLDNCRSEFLSDEATKGMSQPITEADLVKLLMNSVDLQAAIDEKLKASLRNSVLRERHSRKVSSLFSTFKIDDSQKNIPRVNISTGVILEKIKPQQSKVPYGICGYADWLYSRRNAIVHGAGSNKFLKNDLVQLKRLYKSTPAATFRIKLATIKNTAVFYQCVTGIISSAVEALDG